MISPGQRLAIRRKPKRAIAAGARQFVKLLGGLHVPKTDDLVSSRGGKGPAIGREGNAGDQIRVGWDFRGSPEMIRRTGHQPAASTLLRFDPSYFFAARYVPEVRRQRVAEQDFECSLVVTTGEAIQQFTVGRRIAS
jgi:hypothetical protein